MKLNKKIIIILCLVILAFISLVYVAVNAGVANSGASAEIYEAYASGRYI